MATTRPVAQGKPSGRVVLISTSRCLSTECDFEHPGDQENPNAGARAADKHTGVGHPVVITWRPAE